MQPGWSPGRGCGLREQGAPRNLRGDRPAHGKDSYLSPKPVTSVGAPDSWRPKSLSRPLLCWGRVSGDPGAPSSPMAQLCVSSWLSLPHFRASRRPSPSGSRAAPLDRGVGGESSAGATQSPPFSGLVQGTKGGVLASSNNFGPPPPPSQLSPADRRLPRQDPRPMLAYLGVHTKLTGPRRQSHIVGPLLAPAPSPGPRRGDARRRPHSSGWQLQFKRLIKASQRGGGGRAGPVPRPRPGARGATGCAGRRAGGCAPARRRRGPRAPACASSSGQTLFSSSVELRLVKRRRPPPSPLRARPRHRDPCGAAA